MAWKPPPPLTQHWQVRKPAAFGRGGMVVAQAYDAAAAGLTMLEEGGTAADAAVAAAFALAVVEPWNSGLGGIGFCQVAGPSLPPQTIDFGPVAPRGLDPSAYPLTGRIKHDLFPWPEVEGDRNVHGPLSFVVPSAVAGYALLHERYGRLPLSVVMAPASAMAKRGLAQDWFTTLKIAASAAILRLYPESARLYLRDGLPPVPPYQGPTGFLPLGRLPQTLEHLATFGLRDFYEGEVAGELLADFRDLGAPITAADLVACHAVIRPALAAEWRGRELFLARGLTAAPTLLRVLEGMRHAPFDSPQPSPAWYAQLARVMRAAYAERLAGLGDSEAVAAPSCTTHLTVCDRHGMMVAMTTTLLSSMGSRVVLPRSGVLMNNGIMWFDPRPGSANAIAPGKRPLTNMCPLIASEGGKAVLALGASGGRRIMAAVFQLLSYVADFGMSVEEAAHYPRIDVSDPAGVTADRRLGSAVMAALAAEAAVTEVEHAVLPVNFACPNLIRLRPDGLREGISDVMSPWSAALAEAG